MCVVAFVSTNAVYADGVGTGGGASGGSGGGTYGPPYSDKGFGWAMFNSDGSFRPDYFRDGTSWASVQAACSNTVYVIAFVVMEDYSGNPSHGAVYKDDGTWGTYAYQSGGRWLTRKDASDKFYSLPPGLRQGYVFGSNVAWFCYQSKATQWSINGQSYIQAVANSSVKPSAGAHVAGNITNVVPGNRLYWWHDLRNNGPQDMDKKINVVIGKSGFSNNWNGGWSAGQFSGANGQLFFRDYPSGTAETRRYATYDVTENDVGNTLCEDVEWQPATWNNGGVGQSTGRCATVPYNYSLIPTITNIPNDKAMEGGVPNISVNGLVTNNGPTKSQKNIQWQLTKIIYKPGVAINNTGGGISSNDPCAYFAPVSYGANAACSNISSGTQAGGYSNGAAVPYNTVDVAGLGDVPVGTHLCYAMSIKRNSSSSPDWRHSQLYCFIVSKKPKVQILGSDLVVGAQAGTGASVPASSDVITSPTVKTVAGTQKQYGSWVEYGMFVTGVVEGMASSAGYAGGANPSPSLCPFSLLTFSNQSGGSCTDSQIGKYTLSGTSPQVASRFPVTSTTPKISGAVDIDSLASKTTYTTAAGAAITLGATSPVPAGKWVVINAPTATIVITKNITYTNATLHALADIPQVVIIAKNIIVADSVTQIDSWLVAVGTGVDGRLNTCGAGAGITEATLPNANQCNQPLRVNGPVIVNHLFLRRTAGSGTGAASGDPSEVFNLRADAYLWSTSYSPGSARVPDASTKELPPRF
ncbi:MAG TPA: hypothetical protein VN081_06240 [Dongiaceae bacterium]|nr:hypothetical protein [Dongiaceae bacterium]